MVLLDYFGFGCLLGGLVCYELVGFGYVFVGCTC